MIEKIRQQFPEYQDMSDSELMDHIYRAHYGDMPREEFNICCGMPDHEDLEKCAVRGQDSLDLQDIDPSIKPAVKMTFAELTNPLPGKIAIVLDDGTTYIIDPAAVDPSEAMAAILSGDDSGLLGYPEKGNEHAAVTKQGSVITDIPEMRHHAESGNIAWAANGTGDDLTEKAVRVADAINKRRLQ